MNETSGDLWLWHFVLNTLYYFILWDSACIDLWEWNIFLYVALNTTHTIIPFWHWYGWRCYVPPNIFWHFHPPAHLHFVPFSSLTAALPFCDAEQRQSGSPDVYGQPKHAPRGQATWSGCTQWWEGTLAAYREASWQVVSLLIVSPIDPHNNAFRIPNGVFLSAAGLLPFRWTRRPRGRLHSPTISPWTCTDSSSVVFPQRWSRHPTGSTSHSRDVYGTWWSTLCM